MTVRTEDERPLADAGTRDDAVDYPPDALVDGPPPGIPEPPPGTAPPAERPAYQPESARGRRSGRRV